MNVVRGDHIVEHGQTEAFFCLENPVQITAPMLASADGSSLVFFEPLELSAAVERLERFELTARLLSDVPDVAG
jgi:hypothetical protein